MKKRNKLGYLRLLGLILNNPDLYGLFGLFALFALFGLKSGAAD